MWTWWSLKCGMILSGGLSDEFEINLMERLAGTGLSFIVFAISFRTGMRSHFTPVVLGTPRVSDYDEAVKVSLMFGSQIAAHYANVGCR